MSAMPPVLQRTRGTPQTVKPVPNEFPATDPGAIRLALCGESPGADECAMGRPFSGKSGWMLNQWLASAGLSRSQCFVGNVSQIRPGPSAPFGNDFHLLEWHEAPIQEGIAALRADLARFRPHIVVCLGNAPLHLFRHGNVAPPKSQKLRLFQWTSHIGTWRGSLFLGAASFDPMEASDLRFKEGRCPVASQTLSEPSSCQHSIAPSAAPPLGAAPHAAQCGGLTHNSEGPTSASPGDPRPFIPVPANAEPSTDATKGHGDIVGRTGSATLPTGTTFKTLGTYHPAATFREPSFVFPLVSDLKRAVAEARSPELVLPPRNIAWGLSIDELEARCAAIRVAKQPVGFDIEGGLGGLQCCSFATSPSECFVVDLMSEYFDRPRTMAAIASVLEDASVPKVLWNAAYERAVMEAVASITLRNYEDPMIAWWERFSELPKGLDFVASILTREPYWAEGIGWDRKTGQPRVTGPCFWQYNGIDSAVTLEIWQNPLIRAVVESRSPVAFSI